MNVFLQDQSKDTLLSGGELKVDISMFLLLKNEVQIKNIDLENILLKVKRLQPDTVFNFQFIVDAFTGRQTGQNKDTTSLKMNVDNIRLLSAKTSTYARKRSMMSASRSSTRLPMPIIPKAELTNGSNSFSNSSSRCRAWAK